MNNHELGIYLARAIFKCGDDRTPTQRIQFMGGEYPDGEIQQGGLCEGSLAYFIETALDERASAPKTEGKHE